MVVEGMLPTGSIMRIVKPPVIAKGAGFTGEFWAPFNNAICEFAVKLAEAAADEAKLAGRKGITKENLKVAAEKMGVKIE